MCDFAKDPNALPKTDQRKNPTCIKCKRRKCHQPEDEICPLCWALEAINPSSDRQASAQ